MAAAPAALARSLAIGSSSAGRSKGGGRQPTTASLPALVAPCPELGHGHTSASRFARGSGSHRLAIPLRASATSSFPAPSSASSSSHAPAPEGGPVAFFDVDGTILKSNVVTAFLSIKLANMALAEKALFVPFFALQVPIYLLLDRIDRALFNRMFYRNYRGVSVTEKAAMAQLLHHRYVLPRILPDAQAHIRQLRSRGFRIVLVTGSLDFLMEPLAEALECEAVFAARLKEEYGRFSGELEGEAVSSQEKAQLVRQYAAEQGVDLQQCHAYGDSVADLAMLESVGFPHVVRPEARLRKLALQRKWPVLDWRDAASVEAGDPAIAVTVEDKARKSL